ncbi:hypothetical protein FRC05_002591 [Tulasnella sp. 425]|nr:hypothetical protein FRC05_002591 [Tulasnella sp. 425]
MAGLNILVSESYHAIITDFGSARVMESRGEQGEAEIPSSQPPEIAESALVSPSGCLPEGLTVEVLETITGPGWSTRWASPEVLKGEKPDLPSDIWAGGWICWEPKAIPTDKEAGGEPQIRSAELLLTLGDLAFTQADWDKALASYTRAVDVAKSIDNTRVWWRALYQMGTIRLSQRRYDEALSLFNGAGNVAMKCSDSDEFFLGQATSIRQQATVFIIQGQLELAEMVLEQSYGAFRFVDSPSLIPSALLPYLTTRGWLYKKQEKYEKAIKDYKLCCEISAAVGDEYSQAEAAYGMADACYRLERYAEVAEYAEAAAKLFPRVGSDLNNHLPKALSLLGFARKALGMWPQAIAPLEEAAALFRATPTTEHHNLADICKMQADELRYMIGLFDGPGVMRQTIALDPNTPNITITITEDGIVMTPAPSDESNPQV